jgi:hypothetical protein
VFWVSVSELHSEGRMSTLLGGIDGDDLVIVTPTGGVEGSSCKELPFTRRMSHHSVFGSFTGSGPVREGNGSSGGEHTIRPPGGPPCFAQE